MATGRSPETGFSHGFGASPANRELVTWIRDHNASQDSSQHVRFYGFDGPMEISGAPSPRMSLMAAHAYLASRLGSDRLPHDAQTLSMAGHSWSIAYSPKGGR